MKNLLRHCRSILWFLLHSLLNYEKWITCIFLVKNDSMTHKTINLSDMCYFQPPILIKITVNPLLQFLMLPDNQTRHGKFTFFKVKLYKKGKNMFPSQAYRPSRPIWIVKTWFKPIFSFNTTIFSLPRKNVLFISTRPKIHLSIWKWRVSLGPPRNLYLYFPKILKKEQFHIEKPEKNYNTMTYPPSVLSGNTNLKHQK